MFLLFGQGALLSVEMTYLERVLCYQGELPGAKQELAEAHVREVRADPLCCSQRQSSSHLYPVANGYPPGGGALFTSPGPFSRGGGCGSLGLRC